MEHGKVREIDPTTGQVITGLKKIPARITVNHFFLNNKKLPVYLRGYRDDWEANGMKNWDDLELLKIKDLITRYRDKVNTGEMAAIADDNVNKRFIRDRLNREENYEAWHSVR